MDVAVADSKAIDGLTQRQLVSRCCCCVIDGVCWPRVRSIASKAKVSRRREDTHADWILARLRWRLAELVE